MIESKYPQGDSRKKACFELLQEVKVSQQQLRAWTPHGDCNSSSVAASLAIVKPFTDGEYGKIFKLDVANKLFEDFSNENKII